MPKSIALKHISNCYIKPKYEVEDSKKPYILAHWDLIFLSIHYTQKGLLYPKPKHVEFDIEAFLQSLKDSLSLTLVHFYPLAGRLVMNVDEDQHQCTVHLDCNKGSSQGARFIHASLDVTVSDILSSTLKNSAVHSLFDLSNGQVSYDGHTLPNLSVQVTELIDGVFVGCTMNHAIADATSFWHFWNVWSEIQRAGGKPVLVSNPPVIYDRWYPEGYGPEDAVLPFTHPDQFITRYDPPELKEKIFCVGSKEIQKLKSEANADNTDHNNISSFQALVAFIWRCIIRAYDLPLENPTNCFLVANNRSRLTPPLPPTYFGNSTTTFATTCTTVDKLLNSSLGHVAKLLNKSVKNHTGEVVIDMAKAWYKSPFVYESGGFTDTNVNESVYFMSSPRLDMYGNEFAGLGKPIAVKSGFANKFSGQLTAYEGSQGPGSVDFEISLTDNLMRSLESDVEFMSVASTR